MKLTHSNLAAIVLCSLAAVTLIPALRAADLSEADKKFLTVYEHVRAALAADNLAEAKKAAVDLAEEGAADREGRFHHHRARRVFATLSEHAIKLATDRSGYYVVNCPMLKKDWVQPNGKISNPYAGRSMPTCGMIKKSQKLKTEKYTK